MIDAEVADCARRFGRLMVVGRLPASASLAFRKHWLLLVRFSCSALEFTLIEAEAITGVGRGL